MARQTASLHQHGGGRGRDRWHHGGGGALPDYRERPVCEALQHRPVHGAIASGSQRCIPLCVNAVGFGHQTAHQLGDGDDLLPEFVRGSANVVLHLVSVISRHLTVVAAAKADDHPGALHPLSLGIAIHVRVIPLRAFGSGICQVEPDRPFSLIDSDSLDVAVPEQPCSSPIDVAFSEGLAVLHSVRRAVQHEVPDRQVELADRFE